MPDPHYFATWAFSIEAVQRERTTADTFNCPRSPELRCRWNVKGSWCDPRQKVPYAQQRHFGFHYWGRLAWIYHWRHVQLSAVTWTSMSLERRRKLMWSGAEMPDLHYFATVAFSIEAVQCERTTVDTFNYPPLPELRCRWNVEGSGCASGPKCQICNTLLRGLSQLRPSSVSVSLSTRSTVRRHLNFDDAGT